MAAIGNISLCLLFMNLATVLSQVNSPGAPRNVKVGMEDGELLITWDHPKDNQVPVEFYSIWFKTTGMWVPLVDRIEDQTFYKWTGFSRDANYFLRVYSNHGNPPQKTPSRVLQIKAGGSISAGNSVCYLGNIVDLTTVVFIHVFFYIIL